MGDEANRAGSVPLGPARYFPAFLDVASQRALVEDVRSVVAAAPFIRPETRWGKPMSVRMTSAGAVGWVSDRRGYRYEPAHPSGSPWPAVPQRILDIWGAVTANARDPDTCLINYYYGTARMGLHQDKDEAELTWPVVSVSLGDDALFRIGGTDRKDKTVSHWLTSGDVVVLEGAGRLAFHGIDRVRPGSSSLLPNGGRINLTLRVAG